MIKFSFAVFTSEKYYLFDFFKQKSVVGLLIITVSVWANTQFITPAGLYNPYACLLFTTPMNKAG